VAPTSRQLGVRRVGAAALSVALVLGASVGLGVSSASAAATQVSAGAMVSDVNQARGARGLRALSTDSSLAAVALAQARRMASRNTLYHNPNLANDVSNYRWVGENVGYGPSLDAVQNAFMKSPSHKANIVDRSYTQVGIAAVRDGKGRTWVAQVFRAPTSSAGSKSNAKAEKKTNAKPRPKKPRASAKPAKAQTGGTTSKGDAKAPAAKAAPTRSATAAPAPKPPSHRAAPSASASASAAPTLEERVLTATRTAAPGSDPVADALAFAQVMATVGG
jgi:uncharacterized protein YkwD